MRVVLDTNIMVSGTFWTGSSFKILQLVDKDLLTLIVSQLLLKEYDEILHSEEILEKTTIYQQARIQAIQKILSKSLLVDSQISIDVIKDDPDDNKFLEAARVGEAHFIISNDKHLLNLKEYEGIRIVKPEEFLKLVNAFSLAF